MSALDQALIKAYRKPSARPAPAPEGAFWRRVDPGPAAESEPAAPPPHADFSRKPAPEGEAVEAIARLQQQAAQPAGTASPAELHPPPMAVIRAVAAPPPAPAEAVTRIEAGQPLDSPHWAHTELACLQLDAPPAPEPTTTPESGESAPDGGGPGDRVEAAEAAPADRAAAAPPSGASRQPAANWEVDRFQWPEVCSRLREQAADFFADAGRRMEAARRQGLRTLAILGASPGAGCTTFALCLARSVAETAAGAALMELDGEHPSLAAQLGVQPTVDWPEALGRDLPLAEGAIASQDEGLVLLPLAADASRQPDRRVELAPAAVRAAADRFDLLLLDVGAAPESLEVLAPLARQGLIDAAILVADTRRTDVSEAQRLADAMRRTGVEAVALVENFVVD